jgi:quercetin dioxygenase-like cupin family protein
MYSSRPFPLKFELPGGARQLRVERVITCHAHWRMWLHANSDFSLGTFICLFDNSSIERVTWHPDGTETRFTVKEADE